MDAKAWIEHFDTALRIAGRFSRVELRRQARAYLLGLLADVETRSSRQLAEHAGDASRVPQVAGARGHKVGA